MNVPGQLVKPLKIFGIVCGLLMVYSLAGFFLIPAVLKWQLPQIIQQETGRKTTIAKIHFNPFLLTADLQGFELQEAKGQPFAAFDNFAVDLNALKSIRLAALVFDDVRLDKPYVRIARQQSGQFNFNDLLKPKEEEKKEQGGKIFPLAITHLSLAEGRLVWEDAVPATPVKEEANPLNFTIENFSTQDNQQGKVGFTLALSSGGKLDWQSSLGVVPLFSSGRIKLDNLKLERISELALPDKAAFNIKGSPLLEIDYQVSYRDNNLELAISKSKISLTDLQYSAKAPDNLTLQIPAFSLEGAYKVNYKDGTLQLSATGNKAEIHGLQLTGLNPDKSVFKIPSITLEAGYQADYAGDTLAFTAADGKFTVKDFILSEKTHDKSLVKIASLALQGIGFNLNNRELVADAVAIDGANVKAVLESDGSINFQNLFTVPQPGGAPDKTTASPAEPVKAPWLVSVKSLALNHAGIEFEDRTAKKKPALINVSPIDFKLSQFTTQDGAKLPFQFSAGVNKTGLIKLDGDTVIKPLQLQSAIDVKNIALDKFQPYVDQFAHLDIIDGKLNLSGKASVSMDKQDHPDIKFKGHSAIADLITRDRKISKDLVKWKKLTLKDINIDYPANRYAAGALIIERPYVRVTIRKDKTVNFSDVIIADNKPAKAPIKAANKPQPKQSKPSFRLDKFQLIDGSSDFADLSLILPFAAPIKSLDGGARGISSEQKSEIKVALTGNAYDISPVNIQGILSPYLGNYDVELNFEGMPMPLMSPYMAQFAGYKVEKGKLTLGLKYTVADRKLTASNSILIDQFELGEKVENPDAVSLPLGLAVALLKDSNGRIKIDVPITGSLEDPKFSIGGLIFDALVNVLTKIVTSPFNAIASLIGSEKDLSVVNFAAGEAALDKQQTAKLDSVAKALKEKPVLNLEIKGAAFQEQDWPAMQKEALRDQLKQLKAAEVSKEDGRKTRAEYVELSEKDYQRLLAQEFLEKFPMLAEKSFLGAPKLIDQKAGDFYQVAEERLAAIIKPDTQRLKELASERAQAIAKYITQQGGIANQRIFILDTALEPQRENSDIVSFLSLSAN